jgi:hypothetical protein
MGKHVCEVKKCGDFLKLDVWGWPVDSYVTEMFNIFINFFVALRIIFE